MSSNGDTVRRKKHSEKFITIGNDLARDRSLSYEARGLLVELLSRPENWEASIKQLTMPGCGRDKVRRIIKELIKAGYIKDRELISAPGEQFKYSPYIVSEEPEFARCTENPLTENPRTENPHLRNTESTKTEGKKTESTAPQNGATPHQQKSDTSSPATVKAEKPKRPPTPFTLMKDAIFDAFGYVDWDSLTKATAGLINGVAKELLDAGYTPDDVPAIYAYVKAQNFPSFTARALAKHAPAWKAQAAARAEAARRREAEQAALEAERERVVVPSAAERERIRAQVGQVRGGVR